MKKIFTKIVALCLIAIFIFACNSVKRVPRGSALLYKNEIFEDGKMISNEDITNQIYQKPNTKILGLPTQVFLYNWANPNPDSSFQAKFKNNPRKYARMAKWLSAKQVNQLGKSLWYHGVHDALKSIGQAPVIFDKSKAEKSLQRLNYFYFNRGFFNVKTRFTIDSLGYKKNAVKYIVNLGKPYTIDSVTTRISTPALDSLYQTAKEYSYLKPDNVYNYLDFENEKNRITTHFRNNGAYYFQPNDISFKIDTLNRSNKANVDLIIDDHSYQENDSTKTGAFKIYKISAVKIYTDYSAAEPDVKSTDSIYHNNYTLYSKDKLKYKPFAIANAIFITKDDLYSDMATNLTTRYLNNLRVFNYPSIIYEVDKTNPATPSLIAKIYLSPRKKYHFGQSLDANHSDIQTIGIGFSPSISIRNVFKRAETLTFSARTSIGSSKDLSSLNNIPFDVSEYGLNLKLNFPRLLIPINTEKIVPRRMIPSTEIALGFYNQKNIGLDKQNFTGSISYNWTPKKNNTARFDLLNVQFVQNLNPQNYFNIYKSSFSTLNAIAQKSNYIVNPNYFDANKNLIIESGTSSFISDVLNSNIAVSSTDYSAVNSVRERRTRLTENDFILSTNLSFTKTNRNNLTDNNYYLFRTKIESAGSILSLFANSTNLPKDSYGKYKIFNLEYAEYIKSELDFIKLWDLSRGQTFAIRTFFGIAIPFGNSKSIPFSRSYYAGGPNDNRGWRPYGLGPGNSGSVNDFNEANMKIAFSAEFRFKIFKQFNGALFTDAGNIWHILDNVVDSKSNFEGISSIESIAVGSGIGLRYDLSFFIIRFDLGFKTYNPALEANKRWFKDYNFNSSVLQFGIGYPF